MKIMSKTDARTLDTITSCLASPYAPRGKSSRKIETEGWVPLSVERIGDKLYSIAHYVNQNGDLCADPEQTFYRDREGVWVATSYRNDLVGLNRVSVRLNAEEVPVKYVPREQREASAFAATWMRNIRAQHKDALKALAKNLG